MHIKKNDHLYIWQLNALFFGGGGGFLRKPCKVLNWYFELRTSITFPNIRPFFANQPIFSSRSRAVWSSSSSSSSAAVPCVCPSSCRCPHRPVWTSTSASVDTDHYSNHMSRLRDAGFVCCQVIKGRTELTLLKKISSVSAVSMSTV